MFLFYVYALLFAELTTDKKVEGQARMQCSATVVTVGSNVWRFLLLVAGASLVPSYQKSGPGSKVG